MTTLRIVFAISGVFMAVAPLVMIVMRWKAGGSPLEAIRLFRGEVADQIKAHLILSEFVMLAAFAAGGFRVFWLNVTNLEEPLNTAGSFDLWTSALSIVFAAIAPMYRLKVYQLVRNYPEGKSNET